MRAAREAAGLSQSRLALLADLSLETVRQAEVNGGDAHCATLGGLSMALAVPVDALLTLADAAE